MLDNSVLCLMNSKIKWMNGIEKLTNEQCTRMFELT